MLKKIILASGITSKPREVHDQRREGRATANRAQELDTRGRIDVLFTLLAGRGGQLSLNLGYCQQHGRVFRVETARGLIRSPRQFETILFGQGRANRRAVAGFPLVVGNAAVQFERPVNLAG